MSFWNGLPNINSNNINCAGTSNLAGVINIAGETNIAGDVISDNIISNNLTVQNNVNINGNINGNLIPSTSNTYNLGTNDSIWKELNVNTASIVGPTGSWKVSSYGTPGVNFDLVAQQNNINGLTGPIYSLTNKDGLTGPIGPTGSVGPTGPTGSVGATGPTGSVGATGPVGIMSIVNIPSSTGSIAANPTLLASDISYNTFTFTPSATGLFLVQIQNLYSTTNLASTSPLYEARMMIYDASGVISADSSFFSLNNKINTGPSAISSNTWAGSLCCYTNITTTTQKTIQVSISAGSGIAKTGRIQWKQISIIPVQTNSSSTFVTFP